MLEYTSERRCFLMASKGQKFRKYTQEEKDEILKKYNEGISSGFIAKEYGISSSTIREWKYKANHPELISGNKKGRLKEKDLTKEDWKERYEIVKKYQAFLKAQREKK